MKSTVHGTSHFVSRARAAGYYLTTGLASNMSDAKAAVAERLAAGEIHIGQPDLSKYGPKAALVLLDGGRRYGVRVLEG